MKIICAGLAKTGTTSMARALRMLGFTVFDFKEHAAFHDEEWLDIYLKGKTPDFASMYEGVDAVTDLPPSCWFQEISETFPNAKIILTIRDSEDVWLKSYVKQSEVDMNLNDSGFFTTLLMRSWSHRKYYALNDAMNTAAYGSLKTEATVLFKKKYREHNERVQAVIPKEKLLVYNVKQGWKPLCEFLGCEIPEKDFPWLNAGMSDVLERLAKRRQEFAFKVSQILVSFLFLIFLFILLFEIFDVGTLLRI